MQTSSCSSTSLDHFMPFSEALQVSILDACDNELYKGIYLSNNGANLSLLQYADNALFFGEWSRDNALCLIHILRCFELAFGLKVNLDKSKVFGVGVPVNEVISMASSLGCNHDSLPFFYLGLSEWRIPPRGRSMDDLSDMLNLISNLELSSSGLDKWVWVCDTSGMFKTNTLSKSIQDALFNDAAISNPHKWNSWIPRKVNIYVWRVAYDRLPTRTILFHRDISLPSTTCPISDIVEEDIDHCIIRCPRSTCIWRKIWGWWNIDLPLVFPAFSIRD
ncbi:RNA-directed DNA polymerase, eukaryota, reverse transcriptase zinc-binding domain protein, partial [Tanacetum coccineum]